MLETSITDTETPPACDILIVDDMPANLRLLSGMLIRQGYKVRSAPNGKLALMGAQAVQPDLILLDIKMPGMSGYEVCEQLKADPRTQDIPVIFISALDQTEDKIKAFAVGGVDYITKPFRLEEVVARVETHLSLRAMQRQLEEKNAQLKHVNDELTDEIARRDRAEQELERYAAALQRSNQELEQFAYVVSHDLREPVRTVKSYLELLAQRYRDQFDEDADMFINYAIDGATRMQAMIRALLDLSRVETRGETFARTDVEAVVARTLKVLSHAIEEAEADVRYDSLPVVMADQAQLAQVFQNLIANAIKFRRAGVAPRVHITAELLEEDQGTDEWRFSVADNGIGLDPGQAGRIFQIFQRLHTREEYPGTGIGLALCKRIVARHKGRIWVESTPGQGATFYFTLPGG